jgi:1,4-alpha-glucan branching enzyme
MIQADDLLTAEDFHLFNEGTHGCLYQRLGAHPATRHGSAGADFAVWAPNAERVSVIGDFNGWNKSAHVLQPRGASGIWVGFIPSVRHGARYKYHIESRFCNDQMDNADPFGFTHEAPPGNASLVWDLSYQWHDETWMRNRDARFSLESPVSIYEVHLGSWMGDPADPQRLLGCREIAPKLAEYARRLSFTHVEFLPVMEHPFYGSWGYQTTGYFAPSGRYGTPQDLMFLIDLLHQQGMGVILDWVPSHFPNDEDRG